MPNIPVVQPFDVASLYSNAGAATGKAMENVGDAVDKYNAVEKWKQDEGMRLKLRQELIDTYGFKPQDISEKESFDNLARYAYQIETMDKTLEQAKAAGAIGVPDASVARRAALSDKNYFHTGLAEIEKATKKAAEDKQKSQEQEGVASTLKDVSTGLKAGGFDNAPPTVTSGEIPGEVSAASVEGNASRREIPVGEYEGRVQASMKGSKVGSEVTKEAANAAALRTVANPEKIGGQTQETYLGQYRSKDEIINANRPRKGENGGANDDIKNSQVVSFYNTAAKTKSAKEEKIKKTKLEADDIRRNLTALQNGKSIKVDGAFVSPSDSSAIEKFRSKLGTLEGDIAGDEDDLSTAQGEYEAWGAEMRARGLPISKPTAKTREDGGKGKKTATSESDTAYGAGDKVFVVPGAAIKEYNARVKDGRQKISWENISDDAKRRWGELYVSSRKTK